MKKIIVLVLCVILMCAMSLVTSAASIEDTAAWLEAEITTEAIIEYVQVHLEEISVIITLIFTLFYQVRKHAKLNKSIGTLNNNAVAVSENSSSAISQALTGVQTVSDIVAGYKDEMTKLLDEVRANEEEKHKLANALTTVNKYLETTKAANIELANEVAELLVLANIPISKKDELYGRHKAAIEAIEAAEKSEVTANDEQKA